jgi:hypothetical protein
MLTWFLKLFELMADGCQVRSSLYANTQLRAHRRAEKKNKEQKR